MLKLNKPINIKDLQMLLNTVNFDSISNSFKYLYIFSKTDIYLICFLIHYVHMGSDSATFFALYKLSWIFSPILKIDSYLILKSDKKSWHAQTSWMKKNFVNGKNSLERKKFHFSAFRSLVRKIHDRLRIIFINNRMLWLWLRLLLWLFITK